VPVLAGGLAVGAAAGLSTIAAIHWASWGCVQLVAFLTSPILAATLPLELPAAVVRPTVLLGSMLLYAGYALAVIDLRAWHFRWTWALAILAAHGALLIVWVGRILSALPASLV
jgi:hypothetical protein